MNQGERYSCRPAATRAIGAVKPAKRETHPARKPTKGWMVRERNMYSPPDSLRREERAP